MSDEKIIDSKLDSKEGLDGLGREIEIKGAGLELGGEKVEADIFSPEKEVINEISEAEKDSTYNKILSQVPNKDGGENDEAKSDAEIIIQKEMDAQSNIQHLVDLAVSKGVVHAVKVARHMDDNYILDMMHDKMISDDFHKVLVEKNLITND